MDGKSMVNSYAIEINTSFRRGCLVHIQNLVHWHNLRIAYTTNLIFFGYTSVLYLVEQFQSFELFQD